MSVSEEIIQTYKQAKTISPIAIRLSHLIEDPDSSIQDFEDVIKMDPTLVVRLLKLVNSPYYGLSQEVTSISRAVVFIGMKNLRNLVIVAALKDIFRESSPDDVFSRTRLWLHCASVAICSQMISEYMFETKGDDAFLCGILHDIGLIVQDQVVHEPFIHMCQTYDTEAMSITDYEQKMLGTDHSEVGYLLSKQWKLPDPVQQGIKDHHAYDKILEPHSLAGIVQFSEYIVSKLNFCAISGMNPRLSPNLAAFLKHNIDEFNALIKDLSREIEKARDIYDMHEVPA